MTSPMEHALSAYYDITHGEGLAIITPRRKVRGDTQQELHKEVRRTIYEDIDY